MPPGALIPVEVEWLGDNTKRLSFQSEPGFLYHIEQSSNRVDWLVWQSMVAEDTNSVVFSFDPGSRFYRVSQGDTNIQFANWNSSVEMYLNFEVYTPLQGAYTMELLADGVRVFADRGTVPPDGRFGVHDAGYDRSQWPHAPHYAVAQWELVVTVTPKGRGTESHTARVRRQGRGTRNSLVDPLRPSVMPSRLQRRPAFQPGAPATVR